MSKDVYGEIKFSPEMKSLLNNIEKSSYEDGRASMLKEIKAIRGQMKSKIYMNIKTGELVIKHLELTVYKLWYSLWQDSDGYYANDKDFKLDPYNWVMIGWL